MSGIAAIFRRDGESVPHGQIERVIQSLVMYGPEYQRTVMAGPVALAYCHLSNVPESRFESQPILGAGGRFFMVFDGRLDNRDELGATLNIDRSLLSGLADSAIAFRAWEKWGDRAPAHWVGDFAALVWDSVDRRLYATRDHFGRRALSYHERSNRVVVASAPKGIFALGDIERAVDEQKIADILADIYNDPGRSLYKGIRRVRPAHVLTVTQDSVRSTQYWEADLTSKIRLRSDDEYVEAAREHLDRAVAAHSRSPGPIGASMSGGLDSPTMVVSALKFLGDRQKLTVFTCVPGESWDGHCLENRYGDETPFVTATAKMHPGIDLKLLSSPGRKYNHRMEDLFLAAETITRGPLSSFCAHDIQETAKGMGLKVLLEGDMGNLTLSWSGSGAYAEWLRRGRLGRLAKELAVLSDNPYQFVKRFVSHAILPNGPGWLRELHTRLAGRKMPSAPWRQSTALHSDFVREMRIEERAAAFGHNFGARTNPNTRRLRADLLTSDCTLELGDLFQGYRALYGIEVRHPLSDLRLVNWCLSIPEEQYRRNGQPRWLVRRLMRGQVPDCVVDSRTTGMLVPDWPQRIGGDLTRLVNEVDALANDPDTSRMIDIDRLRNSINELRQGTPTLHSFQTTANLSRVLPHAIAVGRFVRWVKGANQ